MSILGGASVIPVAVPALAQATDLSARTKAPTKTPLKRKAPPSLPAISDTYVPPPASETNLDLAKKHFKAGRKHYEKGDYGAALDEFQKSYNLIHILDTQYNIGLCYEKLRVYDKAIEAFQIYLEGKPAKEEQEEAEARILWVQTQIKQQQKKEEPSGQATTVVVPSEEQAPLPKPVRPAETVVAVRRKPKRKVRIPTEETWKMAPQPQEEAPVSPPKTADALPPKEKQKDPVLPPPLPLATDTYLPPPDGTHATIGVTKKTDQPAIPYRKLMWTSFGLSAAGLVTGIVGHIMARQKESEFYEWKSERENNGEIVGCTVDCKYRDRPTETAYKPTENEFHEELEWQKKVVWTGLIGSGVFLGLGGIFYWLDRDSRVRVSGETNSQGGKVNIGILFD